MIERLLRPRILIIKYMKEFLAKGHWVKVIIVFFKVSATAFRLCLTVATYAMESTDRLRPET